MRIFYKIICFGVAASIFGCASVALAGDSSLGGILAPAPKKNNQAAAPAANSSASPASSQFSFIAPSKQQDSAPASQTQTFQQAQQQLQQLQKKQSQQANPSQNDSSTQGYKSYKSYEEYYKDQDKKKATEQANNKNKVEEEKKAAAARYAIQKSKNDMNLDLAKNAALTANNNVKPLSVKSKSMAALMNFKGPDGYPVTSSIKQDLRTFAAQLKTDVLTDSDKRKLVVNKISELQNKKQGIKLQQIYALDAFSKMGMPDSYVSQVKQDQSESLQLIDSTIDKLQKY